MHNRISVENDPWGFYRTKRTPPSFNLKIYANGGQAHQHVT